jgi:3-oxoadipate enol-lactonase
MAGTSQINANGISINYLIEGDGPLVTLSHSLACDLSMWDEQAQALTAHGYRVLRFDTRGHGNTRAPEGEYTLEQLAQDLQGLLTGLGVTQTHFAGLSMGGMIGQVFALKYPGVFQSLVLCDTASRFPPEAAPLWRGRIDIARSKGMEALVIPTLERWFTAPFREANTAVVSRIAKSIRDTPVAGYCGCCAAIPAINVTDQLHNIKCPVLVICGEQDPGTPVAMAREIHAAIPGSELCLLPQAAHLSNLEQPDKFNAALLGFLDKVANKA